MASCICVHKVKRHLTVSCLDSFSAAVGPSAVLFRQQQAYLLTDNVAFCGEFKTAFY